MKGANASFSPGLVGSNHHKCKVPSKTFSSEATSLVMAYNAAAYNTYNRCSTAVSK